MKKIIIIILSIGLNSCAVVKEKTYTKNELTHLIDSVRVRQVSKQLDSFSKVNKTNTTKQINSSFEVRVNCDSLGNVKDLNYKVKSGKNTVHAIIKDNKFSLSINLDSIKNVLKSEYIIQKRQDSSSIVSSQKEKYEKIIESVTVKEQVTLFKHWKCILVICGLAFFLIRKVINY